DFSRGEPLSMCHSQGPCSFAILRARPINRRRRNKKWDATLASPQNGVVRVDSINHHPRPAPPSKSTAVQHSLEDDQTRARFGSSLGAGAVQDKSSVLRGNAVRIGFSAYW